MSASGADAATFWEDYLVDAKPSTFPRRNITSNQSQAIYRHERNSTIPLAKVADFSRKSRLSLQTVGQTVFAIISGYYARTLDVNFGAVLSGRDDEDLSQLLFPTMNTVTIRAILHGTRLEMLHYIQENFTNIKQWQHFPLRKALALAGARGGLFESLFIFQKNMEDDPDDKTRLYDSIESYSNVEYPVCVEMEVVQGQLLWRCAVKETVFDKTATQELLVKLDQVLQEIIERPKESVIEFTSHGMSMCGLPAFEKVEKDEDQPGSQEQGQKDQPRPQTILTIRKILAVVSGIPEADITNDMTVFHIGLDSISIIKVSSLLCKEGITLSASDLLQAGTINEIARTADASSLHDNKNTNGFKPTISGVLHTINRPEILKRAHHKPTTLKDSTAVQILPVTAGQLYMLSMWLNTQGANFYAEFQYDLTGSIALDTLDRGWKDVVKAYPILRSQFLATHDQTVPYVQILRSDGEVVPDIVDLTGKDEEERIETINRKAMEQPWAHLFVLQTSTGWALTLQIHHALYDGVSLPYLMQQLEDNYNGISSPVVDDTLSQYLAACYSGKRSESCKYFWTQYLDGINQCRLRQPNNLTSGTTEVFQPCILPSATLKQTARAHGFSIQSLFIAAYAKIYAALAQTPKERDTVIGIYFANRSLSIEGIETAAIPTVNLLPLRVRSPLEQNLIAVASQIQADLRKISAMPNVFSSLYEIYQWTSIKVDTFVNFLTLPTPNDNKEVASPHKHIKISQISHWEEERARVTDDSVETVQPGHVVDLIDEHVNEIYLHAIDIEAKVRGGVLDIGVFAPVSLLSLAEGEKLVADLRSALEGAL